MKKNKQRKGFTLIELLAVIVILTVIALIASPIIINVIENARMKAFENSVYGVMETYKLKTIGDEEYVGKTYDFPEGNNELKYSGTKMTGGTIFLTPGKDIEVRELTDGRYCATGNKGNLVVKRGNCEIDMANVPVLKKAPTAWGSTFLDTGLDKETIESVEFIMVTSFPAGAVDVSDKGNGEIMLWTKDEDSNGMLEVYVGAINNLVYANQDSSSLFNNLFNIEKLDLSNFDTSEVTNMNFMFAAAGYYVMNFDLNLGDKFDTGKVTNMHGMFANTGQKIV